MTDPNARTIQARSALHARNRPDHVAIVCEDREVTYATLHRESNRTAHALLAAGLERGARVAYLGRESEHYYDLAVACAKSGTVLVPINWRLTPVEVDHILRDSQAELLLVEHEFRRSAERVRADLPRLRDVVQMDTGGDDRASGFLAWKDGHPDTDLEPGTGTDDPVAQMYTSGTTGLPKGVVLAHRTFFAFIDSMQRAGVDWIDWLPEDRSLSGFPGLHAGGYAWFFHCFNVGATSVIMRMWIAEEAVALVERLGITTIWAAPAMLQMMLAEPIATPERFRSLRKVVYGGSPISRELMLECIERLGHVMTQAYACAESGSFVTALTAAEHVPGSPVLASAGRVCPGCQVRIVGDDGEELPQGEIGRIAIWSPAHFVEYWRLPEATEAMLRDGWLFTSDAGYLDERGYLFLRDRVNDTIIVAAQNIYPVEVEEALRAHPAVADVAVFGVPHPRWGEAVRAAVVLREGERATPRDLMRFLRGRIADFKIPTGYSFVDSLPRNPTGKVLRRVLKEQLADGQPATRGAPQPAAPAGAPAR
ncbi:MAG: long-chain-fatty-acid--CoA ligase [Frankiaceae bacterium]